MFSPADRPATSVDCLEYRDSIPVLHLQTIRKRLGLSEDVVPPVMRVQSGFLHTAEEVLGELGVVHRRDYLPEELSGGEQQRAAVASAAA